MLTVCDCGTVMGLVGSRVVRLDRAIAVDTSCHTCTHLCLVELVTGGQELLGEVGWCKTFGITVPQSEECIRPTRCVRGEGSMMRVYP